MHSPLSVPLLRNRSDPNSRRPERTHGRLELLPRRHESNVAGCRPTLLEGRSSVAFSFVMSRRRSASEVVCSQSACQVKAAFDLEKSREQPLNVASTATDTRMLPRPPAKRPRRSAVKMTAPR